METLTAVLLILVAIAIVYEIARRIGVPYPTLLVLGGLALAFVPGLPRIELEPDLVLLVFLPPLLFIAAAETPIRELRANLAPITPARRSAWCSSRWSSSRSWRTRSCRRSSWPAAFTLGAIVGADRRAGGDDGLPPTRGAADHPDAHRGRGPVQRCDRARRLSRGRGRRRRRRSSCPTPLAGFVVAAVGGIAIGVVVGRVSGEILRRLDDPPVEVLISVVIPFAAYLPADELGLSGVLAAVTAGLVIGSRLGTILTPAAGSCG